MSITAMSIYRDTSNFFRNQFTSFLLISIVCTFITVMFSYSLLPNQKQIIILHKTNFLENNVGLFKLVQNMTIEQRKILLRTSIVSACSGLVSNTFLTGSTLFFIQLILAGYRVNILRIISASISIFPKLFILILFITILVQMGMMFLILPGLLLSIIFSLTPIIVMQNKISIFPAMISSYKIVLKNIRLVAPAIIIWFCIKMLLLILLIHTASVILNFDAILLNIISNLLSIILLIYLFRLYMLIHY